MNFEWVINTTTTNIGFSGRGNWGYDFILHFVIKGNILDRGGVCYIFSNIGEETLRLYLGLVRKTPMQKPIIGEDYEP
jgi:hypothetical protein